MREYARKTQRQRKEGKEAIMEKRTSFSVTTAIQAMEERILAVTGLSRTVYHRKALQKYLEQENPQINPRLLITKRSDPLFVRKPASEPVYLSEEDREGLEKLAEKYGTSIGTVFLQALLEYTVVQAELLGLEKDV